VTILLPVACPTLLTPRLTLKPIDKTNACKIFNFWNKDGLAELAGGEAPKNLLSMYSYIKYYEGMNNLGTFKKWSIFLNHSNRLIGDCEIYPMKPQLINWSEFCIGFALEKQFWGQGLMFEALNCALSKVFEQKSVLRVKADVDICNTASIKLLEKLGFHHEGLQKAIFQRGDECFDAMLMALTRKNFLGVDCH